MDKEKLQRIIPHIMSFGVIDPEQRYGDTPREVTISSDIIEEMLEEGILKEITCKKSKNNPEILTRWKLSRSGIGCVLDSEDILQGLAGKRQLVVAEKMDDSAKRRLFRMESASTFFSLCGVDTAMSALKKGCNPFLLGEPNIPEGTNQYHLAVIDEMVSYAKKMNLPPYIGPALFLSSRETGVFTPCEIGRFAAAEIRKTPMRRKKWNGKEVKQKIQQKRQKQHRKQQEIIKCYDDSVGFLLDLQHGDAYHVFCDFAGKDMKWFAKTHTVMLLKLNQYLKRYHKNDIYTQDGKRRTGTINELGQSNAAIILCPNRDDLHEKVMCVPRLYDPYNCVRGVVMDDGGKAQITAMLAQGDKCYEYAVKKWTVDHLTNCGMDIGGPDLVGRYELFGGKLSINTMIDYYAICRDVYDTIVQTGRVPYVVCHEWDAKMMERIMRLALRNRKIKGINVSGQIITIEQNSWARRYPLIPSDVWADDFTFTEPRFWHTFYDVTAEEFSITSSSEEEILQAAKEIAELELYEE